MSDARLFIDTQECVFIIVFLGLFLLLTGTDVLQNGSDAC